MTTRYVTSTTSMIGFGAISIVLFLWITSTYYNTNDSTLSKISYHYQDDNEEVIEIRMNPLTSRKIPIPILYNDLDYVSLLSHSSNASKNNDETNHNDTASTPSNLRQFLYSQRLQQRQQLKHPSLIHLQAKNNVYCQHLHTHDLDDSHQQKLVINAIQNQYHYNWDLALLLSGNNKKKNRQTLPFRTTKTQLSASSTTKSETNRRSNNELPLGYTLGENGDRHHQQKIHHVYNHFQIEIQYIDQNNYDDNDNVNNSNGNSDEITQNKSDVRIINNINIFPFSVNHYEHFQRSYHKKNVSITTAMAMSGDNNNNNNNNDELNNNIQNYNGKSVIHPFCATSAAQNNLEEENLKQPWFSFHQNATTNTDRLAHLKKIPPQMASGKIRYTYDLLWTKIPNDKNNNHNVKLSSSKRWNCPSNSLQRILYWTSHAILLSFAIRLIWIMKEKETFTENTHTTTTSKMMTITQLSIPLLEHQHQIHNLEDEQVYTGSYGGNVIVTSLTSSSSHVMVMTVVCGTGIHILCTITLFLLQLLMASYFRFDDNQKLIIMRINRNLIMEYIIPLYTLTSPISGFVSAQLYEKNEENNNRHFQQHQKNFTMTACAFPFVSLVIYEIMSLFAYYPHNNQYPIPIHTLFILMGLFVSVYVPLVMLGYFVGYKYSDPKKEEKKEEEEENALPDSTINNKKTEKEEAASSTNLSIILSRDDYSNDYSTPQKSCWRMKIRFAITLGFCGFLMISSISLPYDVLINSIWMEEGYLTSPGHDFNAAIIITFLQFLIMLIEASVLSMFFHFNYCQLQLQRQQFQQHPHFFCGENNNNLSSPIWLHSFFNGGGSIGIAFLIRSIISIFKEDLPSFDNGKSTFLIIYFGFMGFISLSLSLINGTIAILSCIYIHNNGNSLEIDPLILQNRKRHSSSNAHDLSFNHDTRQQYHKNHLLPFFYNYR